MITEGRNRQVRRMIEALGAKVLKLVRTQIGPIEIGGLEIGKFRPLADTEIRSLMPPRKPPPADPRPAKSSYWRSAPKSRRHR